MHRLRDPLPHETKFQRIKQITHVIPRTQPKKGILGFLFSMLPAYARRTTKDFFNFLAKSAIQMAIAAPSQE